MDIKDAKRVISNLREVHPGMWVWTVSVEGICVDERRWQEGEGVILVDRVWAEEYVRKNGNPCEDREISFYLETRATALPLPLRHVWQKDHPVDEPTRFEIAQQKRNEKWMEQWCRHTGIPYNGKILPRRGKVPKAIKDKVNRDKAYALVRRVEDETRQLTLFDKVDKELDAEQYKLITA